MAYLYGLSVTGKEVHDLRIRQQPGLDESPRAMSSSASSSWKAALFQSAIRTASSSVRPSASDAPLGKMISPHGPGWPGATPVRHATLLATSAAIAVARRRSASAGDYRQHCSKSKAMWR